MNSNPFILVGIMLLFFADSPAWGQGKGLDGDWQFQLNVGTKSVPEILPFRVKLSERDGQWAASLINGLEEISVGPVAIADRSLVIEIPHYASTLSLQLSNDYQSMVGEWKKRRGKEEQAVVPVSATRYVHPEWSDPSDFLGRWSLKFEDSKDLAVAVLKQVSPSNQVVGTVLTTTGDYRYLAGGVVNGELRMSCFDGAHAFLLTAKKTPQGIAGGFRSGSWYRVKWTATADPNAQLPDAFGQTEWMDKVPLSELQFPNLQNELKSLDAPEFAGQCRIIEVFGSWCPNCHDAGRYLSELHETYGERGLSIIGLAFELTGDFETDAEQVRQFAIRNETKYPLLLAGVADKAAATARLRVLDRVRSYPTMIFLDQTGNVKAIYTGFSGPATGAAHHKLRRQFEAIIEQVLQD